MIKDKIIDIIEDYEFEDFMLNANLTQMEQEAIIKYHSLETFKNV